jgi:CRP/FNR family transcriptional regulator, cyclic AMP receptor protein
MEWPVLAGIPPEDVRELLSIARRRSFDKGEIVFHQDDPADSLHLIVKGRFGMRLRTALGEDVLLDVRGVGDFFGELALVAFEPQRRTATAIALETAETHCVYHRDFTRLRQRYPSVDRILLVVLADQLRRTDQRLLEAHYVDVDKRVLRRLLDLPRTYRDGTGPVTIPLTQHEIAALAGATRQPVNKVLRRWQARGAIELQRGRITIVDPEAVAKGAR